LIFSEGNLGEYSYPKDIKAGFYRLVSRKELWLALLPF